MTLPLLENRRTACDPGFAWPASGTSSPDTIGDPFGHRTFNGHSSGVDFHRGTDHFDAQPGSDGKSPIHGTIVRSHYTHFLFDDAENAEANEESDPNAKATFAINPVDSALRIVGKNDGTVTFPANIPQYRTKRRFSPYGIDGGAQDWMMDLELKTTIATTGKIVIGIFDELANEYATLSYDGTTFTVNGRHAAGAMGVDGMTAAPSTRRWLRIRYQTSTSQILWQHSTDGATWTTIATQGTIGWTRQGCGFIAFVGWVPAAAGGDDTVDVDFFGWWDGLGIGRFGNWVEIANADGKGVLLHFRHLYRLTGEVRPGTLIGKAGNTGFDTVSGRILTSHVHFEWIPNQRYIYSNDDPRNPLAVGILPRPSTSISISVVRDSAMDPVTGTVDCHRLTITVQRGANQNFQIDEFRMEGNLAARTLKWSTRQGLNPADHDANSYDGLYFKPAAFNEASSQYVFELYLSKTVGGATWVAGHVKDTEGNTVWSG